jgi:hypothetical protein
MVIRANGTVTAVLSHGTMRASLAELTGIDLRGLGLNPTVVSPAATSIKPPTSV